MSDQVQACPPSYSTTRKLSGFARNHPVLTVLGVGGAALVGGAELAAGVVLGAGLDALLRRRRPEIGPQAERKAEPQAETQAQVQPHDEARVDAQVQPQAEWKAQVEEHAQPEAERNASHPLREKSRAIVARAPHVLRERARAVFDAARGKPTAGSERYEQSGSEAVSGPHPAEQQRPDEPRAVQPAD